MNRDTEAIKAGLAKLQNDPMTTRTTSRLLMDAIVLLDWLKRDLGVTQLALENLRSAHSSKISDAGEGAVLSTTEDQQTPKKRGRPSKTV